MWRRPKRHDTSRARGKSTACTSTQALHPQHHTPFRRLWRNTPHAGLTRETESARAQKGVPVGFDIKGIVEQGLDKAQDAINEKVGQEVVTDEHIAKVEEIVTDNVSKLTDKFGK